MLEVGAGRGVVVKTLREQGFDCDGVELAPASPVPGVEKYFYSGIGAADLPAEQRECYQAILLLDVIEHIEQPLQFLQMLRDAFPNANKYVIAVPASQSLWSNHDEFYGHFRRYDLPMLTSLAQGLDGKVQSNSYFFRLLYLPVWLQLKLGQPRNTKLATPLGFMAMIHGLIATLAKLDYYLLPDGVPGTSAIVSIDFTSGS